MSTVTVKKGKIGFINDIVRGIKKITNTETLNNQSSNTTASSTISPLLKRISLFLEDEEFEKADDFCEQVLNTDPENATAYIYKLLIEFRCHTTDELFELTTPIDGSKNYAKILRFGNEEHAALLKNASSAIHQNTLMQEENGEEFVEEYDEIDIENEQYYDFDCPYCGEELSFMRWQADKDSTVICPMCERRFKVNFD